MNSWYNRRYALAETAKAFDLALFSVCCVGGSPSPFTLHHRFLPYRSPCSDVTFRRRGIQNLFDRLLFFFYSFVFRFALSFFVPSSLFLSFPFCLFSLAFPSLLLLLLFFFLFFFFIFCGVFFFFIFASPSVRLHPRGHEQTCGQTCIT